LNESTRGAYSTPSREGLILNKLFAYREKDHNRLNKYSIPSKLSLKAASKFTASAYNQYIDKRLARIGLAPRDCTASNPAGAGAYNFQSISALRRKRVWLRETSCLRGSFMIT